MVLEIVLVGQCLDFVISFFPPCIGMRCDMSSALHKSRCFQGSDEKHVQHFWVATLR